MNDHNNIPARPGQRRLSDREIARRLLRVYEILGLFNVEESITETLQPPGDGEKGNRSEAATITCADELSSQQQT